MEENDNKEVEIVYPGSVVIDSLDVIPGQNVYRVGSKIISKRVGVVVKKGSIINVVPLNGVYIPKVGDFVIGEVVDIGVSFWVIDINSPYDAYLGMFDVKDYVEKESDLADYYDVGDLVFAKVSKVTRTKFVNVSLKDPQAKKLGKGMVINVTPSRVPRIIGKGGSMIKLIKDKTNTRIYVGQNGVIWISGENTEIAAEAIFYVEEHSVMKGLTEKVAELLDKRLGDGDGSKESEKE
ncbi:MAG: RNA-binding protein [Candidatus Nanohaloarchaeota archaeon]|nr:RNA-binding protein [Candidatus Nanohaloarchaeota archaeon]